jgi:branched-chain amino acid aminotransferase
VAGSHLASVDGTITAAAEAAIPAIDDGVLRGDGVFEMIRLYDGRPFALAEHLDRLERSAAAIELPVDRTRLERELEPLLGEYGEVDGALRIVLTRGGRRLAFCEPLPQWPAAARVATVTYSPTVILTGVKSISYAANMQATRIAARAGADEAILVRPDGVVLEAPTSALFWVAADGSLRTPSIGAGILESITRARVVAALEVDEGEFPVADLRAAREAFLASTTREIQAISTVDGQPLEQVPGTRTGEAAEALRSAVERDLSS